MQIGIGINIEWSEMETYENEVASSVMRVAPNAKKSNGLKQSRESRVSVRRVRDDYSIETKMI